MPPKISVVLPFRRAASTLSRAIASMAEQSFSDWELILINHNASDESGAVADEWAKQDSRIRVVFESRNGLVSALNRGLAEVRAPRVARMDADDVSHPERLRQQYQFLLAYPKVAAVGCRVRYQAAEPQVGMQVYVDWINSLLTPDAIRRNQFVESPLAHPSVMFRTALLTRYGPYHAGDFPEDYELWLRWLSAGEKIAKCPEVLLDWHDSAQRLSRTHPAYQPEAFYRIKSKYLAQWLARHNPFHPRVVVWGGGRKARQRMQMLEAYGIRITALIDVVPNKTSVLPCIFYQDVAPPGRYFILSYVGNRGKREEVREFLEQRGYREAINFLLAA